MHSFDLSIQIDAKEAPSWLQSYLDTTQIIYQSNIQNKIVNTQLKNNVTDIVRCKTPGRQRQHKKICQYIESLKYGTQAPLCISGTTGCGKTSIIQNIMGQLSSCRLYKIAYINCMTMMGTKKIYDYLLNEFYNTKSRRPQSALEKFILSQNYDNSQQVIKIAIFDEIDQFTNSKSFIYNILEWCQSSSCPFGLILISNKVDLTETLQSKLRSRMKFSPLIFAPYDFTALKNIIQYKYQSVIDRFEKDTVILLCKKLANDKSDVRILQRYLQQMLLKFEDSKSMITIKDLNSMSSNQSNDLQKLLEPYQFLMNLLVKSPKKCNITEQVINQSRINLKLQLANTEILSMLVDLRDFGIIELKEDFKNCQLIYESWGINLTGFLYVLYANRIQ